VAWSITQQRVSGIVEWRFPISVRQTGFTRCTSAVATGQLAATPSDGIPKNILKGVDSLRDGLFDCLATDFGRFRNGGGNVEQLVIGKEFVSKRLFQPL
jgi:hypothetical protein